MTLHNAANYALSSMAICVALGVGLGLGTALREEKTERVTQQASIDHVAAHKGDKGSSHAWPSLTEDQTIALSEGIKRLDTPAKKMTLYCSSSSCEYIRNDFDDALQIAGWVSDYEDRPVDSESDVGVFVGPPSDQAEKLRQTIESTTGIKAEMVDMEKFGIIIGKVK